MNRNINIKIGAAISCGLSALLSIVFFVGFAPGLIIAIPYACMALVIELCKFTTFKDWLEDRKLSDALVFSLLLTISVAASVSAMAMTMEIHKKAYRTSEDVIERLQGDEIALINKITNKQGMIDGYLKHDKITLGAAPVQKEIDLLTAELATVKQSIRDVPQKAATPISVIVSRIASLFNIDEENASTGLFIVIAIVLEIVSLCLVSKLPRASTLETIDETISETTPPTKPKKPVELTVVETGPYNVKEVTEAIRGGNIPVSVRGCQRALGLNSHQAVALFKDLSKAGIVKKQENGRYKLLNAA